jgi:hypothetical protein
VDKGEMNSMRKGMKEKKEREKGSGKKEREK